MTSPLLLLFLPIVGAFIAYILRRWKPARLITALVTLGLLILVVALTRENQIASETGSNQFLSSVWLIFGRSFQVNSFVRQALLLIYCGIGLAVLLSAVLPQGRLFIPLVLLILTPVAGVLLAEQVEYAAAFVLILSAALAVIIQADRAGSTLTSLRYLILAVMALPMVLAVSWLLQSGQPTANSWASLLMLLAFLILLAAFPFQIWIGPTITESRSLVPYVVFGLAQIVIVLFCLKLITLAPGIYGNARFLEILRISGALTIIAGAILILLAPSLDRLIGYLLLIDIGATAMTFGLGGKAGLELTGYLVLNRSIGLVIAGFGLGLIRFRIPDLQDRTRNGGKLTGLAWQSPLGLALFIYGGLSLAGLPLTPGFAGHWALVTLVGARQSWQAIVLIIALITSLFGVVKMVLPMYAPGTGLVEKEPRLMRITAGLLLIAGLLATIGSSWLMSLSLRLVEAL